MVAALLIADAVIGHSMFRAGFADAGSQPVLAATAGAIFVAAIAIMVVVHPSKLVLQLARGVAAGMVIGLALAGLLFFVAANFESGVSSGEQSEAILWGVILLVSQLGILVGCYFLEETTFIESIASTAVGTFKFWLVAVVFIVAGEMFG